MQVYKYTPPPSGTGAGTWEKVGGAINGEAVNDRSGTSVSLSPDGTVVAIGAPGNSGGKGHVRIHKYNGTTWEQQGAEIDGAAAGDRSGTSVSLSADGKTVAIGGTFQ